MLQTITTIPDYKVYEYLLILTPTGEVYQQIWAIKHDFAKRYKALLAAYTKPHLTLINFLAYKKTEEKILNRFRLISAGITPFNVGLEDFGSFGSHTIFVNVATKIAVLNLILELKQARRLLTLNRSNAAYFSGTPHLSICRGLAPWQHKLGWSVYSTCRFIGSFVAGEMTLLKRAYGENKCETVEQFTFRSTPSLPRQGVLFL